MRSSMLVLILLAVTPLLGACQPVRPPPALAVTLSKPEDKAQVRWEGDVLLVDITSPSGIGSAHIEWGAGAAGDALLLRLHLKGLEGFEANNGLQRAALAVDHAPPYAVRSEGGAQGIDVVRGQGFFTVSLAEEWLRNGSLDVRWIDFYR